MTKSALRVIIRVIERRYKHGENINDILADYPKLTLKERKEIKMVVTGNG